MIKKQILAGVDEAGRGPLAGPVVAAAVIIDKVIEGVTDSKKISESKRFELAILIQKHARAIGIGYADQQEIDSLNIHNATLLAMKRAILKLEITPNEVIIDGCFIPDGLSMQASSLIKGDLKNYSIAAASIIAKTTRDSLMIAAEEQYPEYGFKKHKGYPTKAHILAIETFGITPLHRKSFAPIKNLTG